MTWLKIVPDSEPDADGEWIEISDDRTLSGTLSGMSFHRAVSLFAPAIPRDHHIVAVQERPPPK